MLAHIELKYYWIHAFCKLPLTEWEAIRAELCEILPTISHSLMALKEYDEPNAQGFLRDGYLDNHHIIDLATDGIRLSMLGVEYTIKRFKGAYMASSVPKSSEVIQGNTTVIQVAIPDLALLSIKAVCVLEDACTAVLQKHLDEGWRILVICPPHAQRRPDYILGHTDQSLRVY